MSIAKKRKEKGLTQVQLAAELDVSPAAVAMWETNERVPRMDKLLAMAELFGCTLDELVKKEGEAQ